MIGRDEVTGCGSILRSHGVNGDVVVPVDYGFVEESGMEFIALDMDGILVPFFIESARRRDSSSSILKLEGIDSLESADALRGRKVFLFRKYVGDDIDVQSLPDVFIGLEATDRRAGKLGKITAVDDSTANILFRITSSDGRELIVPASPELIENVDVRRGLVRFDLPEGLTDI